MIVLSIIILLPVLFVYVFLKQPQFGKLSSGAGLEQLKKSPNYSGGKFQNLNLTPDLAEGVTYFQVLKEFIFNKDKRLVPSQPLPAEKTNLLSLHSDKNVFVWFGHGSYFLQIDGKKILVDPVLSGHASPAKFITKAYPGTDVYTPDDIPEIDYLFISHDHWDHLDYKAIVKLKPKIKKVIVGLGVSIHLERWGYDKSKIIEKDWNEEIILEDGFVVTTATARHFSGRTFKRNQSLWMSYILKTPTKKIFIGGDSGYGTHFANIGQSSGPFDLAILECGQYNHNWKYIHMMPEEVVQAAIDLKAKKFIPVHWGKFSLGQHAWDEPILRVTAEANRKNVSLIHPMIGEEVSLDKEKTFSEWWLSIN